ncbi:hypothetical protein B0H17DRAFT_1145252 [Mycena rosella]|uniref:Uncharacterized protein n=1 Tax=Mycena rosella TaxID=1033263 RepID=A0AAD7CUE8_MYCRO|nr:hypothetical protein B0H17DRAFT_1145252 [Mycena rosella]
MSRPSSVPLLPAREGEVLRRCDATLPVGFPRSDAVFAAGAAVGPCNMPTLLSSNHRNGMDSVEGTTDIATGPEVLVDVVPHSPWNSLKLVPLLALQTHSRRGILCSLGRPYDGNGRNASETCIASVPTPWAAREALRWLEYYIVRSYPCIKGESLQAQQRLQNKVWVSATCAEDGTITSYSQPRARVLHPYISKLYLVYYEIKEDISLERSTFFVDRSGQIFMFRSFRAQWLMDHVEEVEVTHDILVGGDSSSDAICDLCHDGLRETVVQRPHLTSWHVKHQARVDAFMAQPIVKRIINWISDVVEIVVPGIAHQFKQDAKWHEECYGIKPLFGLFWNLCFNAWFHDQRTNVACHLGGWSRCAPESNDAPEPPDVNALLPTVFNLLHQLGVNPSGLLSVEVIKLQKQISLNATFMSRNPSQKPSTGTNRDNVIDETMRNSVVVENLEPRRIHNGRRKEVDSYIAALVANEPMAGYVEICGY